MPSIPTPKRQAKNMRSVVLDESDDGFTELLYNLLMIKIEPELTTYAMECHQYWFTGETPEEKQTRMHRYAEAFKILQERFGIIAGSWRSQIADFKRNAIKDMAKDEGEKDRSHLTDVEHSISDS